MGRWKRPPEFLLLGVTPEAWTPVDSLAVARLLAWRLAENRRGELVRGRLTRAIGPAETNLLMGPMPPGAPAILDAAGPGAAHGTAAPRPRVRRNRSDLGTRGSRRRPCLRASSGSISRRAPATATAG